MKWKPIILGILLLTTFGACTGVSESQPGINPSATSSPLDPLPGEDDMARGEATITTSQLLVMESYPLQIAIEVSGTLPTPCHHLRANVQEPDQENVIQVEVYSLVDPSEICVQVLETYEASIPLGSYPDGAYTVYLNGEYLGDFTQ